MLQPQVLMVVVITSTGGVTKRMFTFARPVDPGLADWAASYLNERLVGLGLGARMLHQRLHDPSLSATESEFIDALAPVFTELESDQDTLYVEGTARLLSPERFGDVSELNALMDMLERRVTLLGVLRSVLGERDVLVRIGAENESPALRSLAFVAAELRPAPAQPGGGVGDRAAADGLRPGDPLRARGGAQLSSFIADVYDEPWERTSRATRSDATRLLRGARRLPRRRRG